MTALQAEARVPSSRAAMPFHGFVCDETTRSVIETACRALGLDDECVVISEPDITVEWLEQSQTPDLLLVDLGASTDILADVGRLSEVCDANTRVVLVGEVNDLKLYRDLMAAGVTDYLVKPLRTEEVVAALEQATHYDEQVQYSKPASEQEAETRVAAVIGARGGVGASTVAANSAWFAANKLDLDVTLIDMDLTFGTLAVMFDVDPGAGLSDAMAEPERMDELFIKRALVKLSDRLRLMAAEADPSRGDLASAQAFKGILQHVRPSADLIVVDLPRNVAVNHLKLMELFDHIILVGEPNLASMRDCARIRTVVAAVNPDAEVSIILNRRGLSPKEELSVAMFEEGAGLKIEGMLPFDAKSAMHADARGGCVMDTASNSKLGKSMDGVSRVVAGKQDEEKASRLSSLFRFKRQSASA